MIYPYFVLICSCFLFFWLDITFGYITYHNIGFDSSSGLSFSRAHGNNFIPANVSFSEVVWEDPISGVVIFDYDNDGDLDIFVNNGPGAYPSLFQNQLMQSSPSAPLSFIDVAQSAGFGDSLAYNTWGEGACYGDIDNDGDDDLLVLTATQMNYLYINNGDGTFTYNEGNGIDNIQRQNHSTSCSFGDINNDGYLDVAIANNADISNTGLQSAYAFNTEGLAYSLNEPNELYLNNGDNTFSDVSERISATRYSVGDDPATIWDGNNSETWAISMVDINRDGWIDIVEANDQFGGFINNARPRGINQIFYNQGNGTFISIPFGFVGSWMSVEHGDLTCDGNIDLFISNFGSYARDVVAPYSLNYPTRFFIQDEFANGYFEPDTIDFDNYSYVSPFGWGCAIFDYDNDADFDILSHGGLDTIYFGFILDNAGFIFENVDGCWNEFSVLDNAITHTFEMDPKCFNVTNNSRCTYHVARETWAVAVGDLNNDGFYDIVSTSASRIDWDTWPTPQHISPKGNELFDSLAYKFDSYYTVAPDFSELYYRGFAPLPGDLFVEISSANNGNNWAKITAKGSFNLGNISGEVNRAGIGAILVWMPIESNGNYMTKNMTKSIAGGSSSSSQHSLQQIFGLGSKSKADLMIFWPSATNPNGYNKNAWCNIKKFEDLTLYEMPCDYPNGGTQTEKNQYRDCVYAALDELQALGLVTVNQKNRLINSCNDATSKGHVGNGNGNNMMSNDPELIDLSSLIANHANNNNKCTLFVASIIIMVYVIFRN